jgi:hypothetical protein
MLVLFSLEEELKRARQTGAVGFAKTLNNRMEGELPPHPPAQADGPVATPLSRLTGRQAGTLLANEFRARARWSRFAIVQLLLSCPPPPQTAIGLDDTPLTHWRMPGVSHRDPLCMFSAASQTAAVLSAIQIRCGLTQLTGHNSPAPIVRWVSADLIVEDLQNGRELKASMRFAARNRKNRVNIGLSAARVGSRSRAAAAVCDQDIESI